MFLKAVSDAALRRGSPPPLHAGEIIRQFVGTRPMDLLRDLAAATERNAAVSRLRRFGLLFFSALPALLVNLLTPARSLQDRIVGTWLVPR